MTDHHPDQAREHITPEVAAQLDAADSQPDTPSAPAVPPDPMSKVIEEDEEARRDGDPEDLADGAEW